jgi:hypothetical protein
MTKRQQLGYRFLWGAFWCFSLSLLLMTEERVVWYLSGLINGVGLIIFYLAFIKKPKED